MLSLPEAMDGGAAFRKGEGPLLVPAGPVARMKSAKSPKDSLAIRASRACTWPRDARLVWEAPLLGARGTGPEKVDLVDFLGLCECIDDPFWRLADGLLLSSLEVATRADEAPLLEDRDRFLLMRLTSSLLRDLVCARLVVTDDA